MSSFFLDGRHPSQYERVASCRTPPQSLHALGITAPNRFDGVGFRRWGSLPARRFPWVSRVGVAREPTRRFPWKMRATSSTIGATIERHMGRVSAR